MKSDLVAKEKPRKVTLTLEQTAVVLSNILRRILPRMDRCHCFHLQIMKTFFPLSCIIEFVELMSEFVPKIQVSCLPKKENNKLSVCEKCNKNGKQKQLQLPTHLQVLPLKFVQTEIVHSNYCVLSSLDALCFNSCITPTKVCWRTEV